MPNINPFIWLESRVPLLSQYVGTLFPNTESHLLPGYSTKLDQIAHEQSIRTRGCNCENRIWKVQSVAMEMRKFSRRAPICNSGHNNLHTKIGKIYLMVLEIKPIATAWQPEWDGYFCEAMSIPFDSYPTWLTRALVRGKALFLYIFLFNSILPLPRLLQLPMVGPPALTYS